MMWVGIYAMQSYYRRIFEVISLHSYFLITSCVEVTTLDLEKYVFNMESALFQKYPSDN